MLTINETTYSKQLPETVEVAPYTPDNWITSKVRETAGLPPRTDYLGLVQEFEVLHEMIIHDVEWDMDDATEDPAIILTEQWQKDVRNSAERIPTHPQAILANPTPVKYAALRAMFEDWTPACAEVGRCLDELLAVVEGRQIGVPDLCIYNVRVAVKALNEQTDARLAYRESLEAGMN
jgi:hypothetical protein